MTAMVTIYNCDDQTSIRIRKLIIEVEDKNLSLLFSFQCEVINYGFKVGFYGAFHLSLETIRTVITMASSLLLFTLAITYN
jgi:hypothetical protein